MSNETIIIQPGSYYLRFGLASKLKCFTVPHCIAHRHKISSQLKCDDSWIWRKEFPRVEESHMALMNEGLEEAKLTLQRRPLASGDTRPLTSPEKLLVSNLNNKTDAADVGTKLSWTDTPHKPNFIVGKDALYLHPDDCYDLHWPIRRGQLNLHPGPGGNLMSVQADLSTIWLNAIKEYLNVSASDVPNFNCLILIPDVYFHQEVEIFLKIALNELHFKSAMLHQESVCALFGTNLSSACVADIGDQKLCISCVHQGISLPLTKYCMKIGGSDITRIFFLLLQRIGFPYKNCKMSNYLDSFLLQELKEKWCHLDQDTFGEEAKFFAMHQPSVPIIKYSMTIGDESILAPLAFFFPKMYGFVPEDCKNLTFHQTKYRGSSTDVLFDVHENFKGCEKDEKRLENNNATPGILGLDEAILYSISKCPTDEIKNEMYKSILIIGGGGALFRGISRWLQYKLWTGMPSTHRTALDAMNIMTKYDNTDPRELSWIGAAKFAYSVALDKSGEIGKNMWITEQEYKEMGTRILREKAPFLW